MRARRGQRRRQAQPAVPAQVEQGQRGPARRLKRGARARVQLGAQHGELDEARAEAAAEHADGVAAGRVAAERARGVLAQADRELELHERGRAGRPRAHERDRVRVVELGAA